MANEETIDLTGSSPPPSQRSRRLRPINSSRRTRPRRDFLCLDCAMCLIANNTNNNFNIHGSQIQTTAGINYYVPVSELAAASSYPLGSTFNRALIPQHDLLMLGLMRHWRKNMRNTARNMVWNNWIPQTPPQVADRNVKYFYGNQPWAYSYNAATTTAADANIIADSNLFTINHVMPINPQPRTMLPLFPENARLLLEEVNNGNDNGFQMQTSVDDVTSMTGSVEGELDLELNLGWSK